MDGWMGGISRSCATHDSSSATMTTIDEDGYLKNLEKLSSVRLINYLALPV